MALVSIHGFIKMSKAELAENSELYDITTNTIRQSLKQQGYQVEATKKIQPIKNYNLDNINSNNNSNEINNSLEQHPELPYTGGKSIDQPMIPENALDAVPESLLSPEQKTKISEKRQKQREKQRLALANRLQNKFKITPKIQPTSKPRYIHTPPKLRPPGG